MSLTKRTERLYQVGSRLFYEGTWQHTGTQVVRKILIDPLDPTPSSGLTVDQTPYGPKKVYTRIKVLRAALTASPGDTSVKDNFGSWSISLGGFSGPGFLSGVAVLSIPLNGGAAVDLTEHPDGGVMVIGTPDSTNEKVHLQYEPPQDAITTGDICSVFIDMDLVVQDGRTTFPT